MDLFHDGVVIVDARGQILYVNQANERITGMTKEAIIGKHVKEVVSESHILNVLQTGSSIIDIPTKVNDKVVISNIVPINHPNGEFLGVVSIFRDLTEILHLNRKLSEAENVIQDLRQKLSVANVTNEKGMIIGSSLSMKKIVHLALKAAQVQSTVTIEGESGTGKEMLAKFIHDHSERVDKPFVTLNATSIPETLLESELFGYEEGAFSGAKRGGKPGLFELADGGTLFLDELEDLSLSVQAKLLRVIQFKELIRVGGTKKKTVNVRFIGASNQSLEKLVQEKKFRDDLYYRLNVVKIKLPPLRERAEDIPLFIQHIVQKMTKKLNKPIREIHPEVIRRLLHYSFPGNIRELENILELSIILDENQILEWHDLPESIKSSGTSTSLSQEEESLPTLEEAELKLMKKALERWSVSVAAQNLGISRATLYRKMKKFGFPI